MSVYNRKGGSGRAGNLRQQFNYYKNQLKERYIKEEAFLRARGGAPEQRPFNLFKHYDYDDIMEHGITRKEGWKTLHIKGEEAIKIQIESFRARASKSYQAQIYITNYCNAMLEVGFDDEDVEEVERLLNSVSVDKLSIMIDRNMLPQIYFLYSDFEDAEYIMKQIKEAVKNAKKLTQEVKMYKQIAKLEEIPIRERFKREGF